MAVIDMFVSEEIERGGEEIVVVWEEEEGGAVNY